MRLVLVAALVLASSLVSSANAAITYRVIDGAVAKKIDKFCALTWLDDDEVLVIEYRSRTYLLRTNGGDVGRACKVN